MENETKVKVHSNSLHHYLMDLTYFTRISTNALFVRVKNYKDDVFDSKEVAAYY